MTSSIYARRLASHLKSKFDIVILTGPEDWDIISEEQIAAAIDELGTPEEVRYELASAAWREFKKIPVDDEILEPYLHFPTGTRIEEVWAWFEQEFEIDVRDLMF
jgi:hypothetical protein